MSIERNAFELIVEDMNEQKTLIENRICDEVEYSHDDKIRFFKAGLSKEVESYFEKELNELRLFAANETSQFKLSEKRKLLSRRHTLVESMFKEIEEEIKSFINSSEYKKFITKKIDTLNDISKGAIFIVRDEDEELISEIMKSKGLNNKVEVDYLPLGGFIINDLEKGRNFDFALDSKLKEQKKWFQNYSGFTFGGE